MVKGGEIIFYGLRRKEGGYRIGRKVSGIQGWKVKKNMKKFMASQVDLYFYI